MQRSSVVSLTVALIGACASDPEMPGPVPPDPPGPGDRATALVLRQGAPAADVTVAFHDSAGNPLAVAVTGADGTAEGPMGAGGMITVPHPRSAGVTLETMTGVQPGEMIVFGMAAEDIASDLAGTLHIESPPVQNTPKYTIDGGCRSAEVTSLDPAPELAVGTACASTGVTSVIVASRDNQGLPYSWAGATDIPVTAGSVSAAALTPWSTDWMGMSLTVTSLPDRTLGLIASAHAVHRDIPFRALGVPNQVNGYPDASASMILGYPHFGDGLEYMTDLVTGEGDLVTGTSRIVARTTQVDQIVLDGRADFLATIPGVTVDRSTPARTRSTWSLAPSHAVDAALVRVAGTSSAGATTWMVMAAPDAGELVTPSLPPELAVYAPSAVTAIDVALIDDASETSFDEVRQGIGTSLLERPLRGPSAKVRYVLEHRE